MKYIDAEKLKETIKYHIRCFEKELQSFSDEDYVCSTAAQYATEKATLENVQNIIDSLQHEQPEVDLDELINDFLLNNSEFLVERDSKVVVQKLARHFYELGKLNARKEG